MPFTNPNILLLTVYCKSYQIHKFKSKNIYTFLSLSHLKPWIMFTSTNLIEFSREIQLPLESDSDNMLYIDLTIDGLAVSSLKIFT